MILWTIAFTPEDSVYEVPPVALECDNYVAHLSRYRVRQGLRMATVDEGVKWVDIRWVWLLFSLLDHCSIELFSLSLSARANVFGSVCVGKLWTIFWDSVFGENIGNVQCLLAKSRIHLHTRWRRGNTVVLPLARLYSFSEIRFSASFSYAPWSSRFFSLARSTENVGSHYLREFTPNHLRGCVFRFCMEKQWEPLCLLAVSRIHRVNDGGSHTHPTTIFSEITFSASCLRFLFIWLIPWLIPRRM